MFNLEGCWPGVGIILIISFLAAFIVYRFRSAGIVHLAVTNLLIQPAAGDRVWIEGRKTGVMDWFSRWIRIGNRYRIRVRSTHFSYSQHDAVGEELCLIPMHEIVETRCGYRRPLPAVILAAGWVVIASFLLYKGFLYPATIAFLLALVCAAVYLLSRNYVILLYTKRRGCIGFSFKQRYQENIPVDMDQLVTAIEIINQLAVEASASETKTDFKTLF